MYTDFKMFTGENDHSETFKVSKYKSEACDLKKYIIGQVLIVQLSPVWDEHRSSRRQNWRNRATCFGSHRGYHK